MIKTCQTGHCYLTSLFVRRRSMALRMKKTATIKKNSDFLRVYKTGRYYASKFLVLYTLIFNADDKSAKTTGTADTNFLGVVAGRKTGKSVRRNRVKRLIKENYRQIEECARDGFFFVFVARAQQDGYIPDFQEIRREMKHLLARAGAFDQQKWEHSQNEAL